MNIRQRFQRTADMMREYAEKASQSKNGKYRGYTAEQANALADHSQKIADGKLRIGTPINWADYNIGVE